VSIGSISGADTYNGSHLTLPAVQLIGGNLYTNVVVAVSPADIVSVGGGMPTVDQNQYNPANLNQLTIPIIQVGGKIYTNVVVTVNASQVRSVGGSLGGASVNRWRLLFLAAILLSMAQPAMAAPTSRVRYFVSPRPARTRSFTPLGQLAETVALL
jgi:hypothetical protein